MLTDDPEGEAILRALAGEATTAPRIQKMGGRDRRIFNTWRRPFPYLFARWEIVTEMGAVSWGSKRKVSRWVNQYYREDLAEWERNGPGPSYAAVPWLVHTNCDKRHRCPVCCHSGGFQGEMAATGGYIKDWHTYTCTICGQRTAKRFYLREHPCDRCRPFSHIRWRVHYSRLRLSNWWYEQRRRLGF